MRILSNRKYDEQTCPIVFGGGNLYPQRDCRFLGVSLDKRLNFSQHIDNIVSKISKNTGILYKLQSLLPLQARINFYYAFIYPYISYNVIIWGATNGIHLQPLIIQHKRTIRTIACSGRYDSTDAIFKQLKLLKFPDVYRYNLAVYMHRSIDHECFQVPHSIDTRQQNLALPHFHRLAQCQHAISYMGPTIWNQIPFIYVK